VKLTFAGAAECVTGSRTLVEGNGTTMLVDCGLFQGYKQLRLLNWKRFPVKPSRIEAVALTHAHLDHIGWLPRLMREGFDGPVHCSPATSDLARILLEDAARIQESDARQANAQGFSRHQPAKPLYTLAEAKGILRRFKAVPVGAWSKVGDLRIRFTPNGHILGSSMVEVQGDETVLFSGDVGRPQDAVMPAPEDPRPCDVLVLESTYGGRFHGKESPVDALRGLLATVRRRHGILVIPSFAVGRSQALLLNLHEAMRSGKLSMPVYLDSPMSIRAVAAMTKHIALTRIAPGHWQEVVRASTWCRTPTTPPACTTCPRRSSSSPRAEWRPAGASFRTWQHSRRPPATRSSWQDTRPAAPAARRYCKAPRRSASMADGSRCAPASAGWRTSPRTPTRANSSIGWAGWRFPPVRPT
jgi:metallo-beta-lactamase family protein